MVGDTRHNILSTTSLTQSGWTFTQKNGCAMLVCEDTGLHSHEVVMFAGCPWVRLHPHARIDGKHESVDLSCSADSEGPVCRKLPRLSSNYSIGIKDTPHIILVVLNILGKEP